MNDFKIFLQAMEDVLGISKKYFKITFFDSENEQTKLEDQHDFQYFWENFSDQASGLITIENILPEPTAEI